MSKIIITAAITGSIHIPTMSEYLPITPDQIVEDTVKAYEAGAALAHIHVRIPETGKPTADPALFERGHEQDQTAVRYHLASHHRRRAESDGGGKTHTHSQTQAGDVLLRSRAFQPGYFRNGQKIPGSI